MWVTTGMLHTCVSTTSDNIMIVQAIERLRVSIDAGFNKIWIELQQLRQEVRQLG
jgi:hypothetical protein